MCVMHTHVLTALNDDEFFDAFETELEAIEASHHAKTLALLVLLLSIVIGRVNDIIHICSFCLSCRISGNTACDDGSAVMPICRSFARKG